MGGIDLDPATTEEFNSTVGAETIYTQTTNGLAYPWHGRVFINPPGGMIRDANGRRRSSMLVWWEKLIEEWAAGRTKQAVFVGFTLEILRLSQQTKHAVQDFPRCYPKARLRFGGDSPTHANVIAYLPSGVSSYRTFSRAFQHIGLTERGRLYP
jgi:hypothetical protein